MVGLLENLPREKAGEQRQVTPKEATTKGGKQAFQMNLKWQCYQPNK
jgi:hypothetical protein